MTRQPTQGQKSVYIEDDDIRDNCVTDELSKKWEVDNTEGGNT